jgi:hypothetical protein
LSRLLLPWFLLAGDFPLDGFLRPLAVVFSLDIDERPLRDDPVDDLLSLREVQGDPTAADRLAALRRLTDPPPSLCNPTDALLLRPFTSITDDLFFFDLAPLSDGRAGICWSFCVDADPESGSLSPG